MKIKSSFLHLHKYNIGLEIFIEWKSRQPGEHNIRPPPQEKIVNPRLTSAIDFGPDLSTRL